VEVFGFCGTHCGHFPVQACVYACRFPTVLRT